jgi:hypothetical protein
VVFVCRAVRDSPSLFLSLSLAASQPQSHSPAQVSPLPPKLQLQLQLLLILLILNTTQSPNSSTTHKLLLGHKPSFSHCCSASSHSSNPPLLALSYLSSRYLLLLPYPLLPCLPNSRCMRACPRCSLPRSLSLALSSALGLGLLPFTFRLVVQEDRTRIIIPIPEGWQPSLSPAPATPDQPLRIRSPIFSASTTSILPLPVPFPSRTSTCPSARLAQRPPRSPRPRLSLLRPRRSLYRLNPSSTLPIAMSACPGATILSTRLMLPA